MAGRKPDYRLVVPSDNGKGKTNHFRILSQLRVFGFGLLQDGDFGIGVFPEREEIFVGGQSMSAGGVSICAQQRFWTARRWHPSRNFLSGLAHAFKTLSKLHNGYVEGIADCNHVQELKVTLTGFILANESLPGPDALRQLSLGESLLLTECKSWRKIFRSGCFLIDRCVGLAIEIRLP